MSLSEEKEKALFDQEAEGYTKKYLVPYCERARRLLVESTLRGIQPLGDLLDVGCGPGFPATYLHGQYDQYVGFDISAGLIELAREYNQFDNVRFEAVSAGEYQDGQQFDVIMLLGVLHHLEDPVSALVHLKPLLKPGGVFAIHEPQQGNPLISLSRNLRKHVDAKYSDDQLEISARRFREILEQAGLEGTLYPQGYLSTPFAQTTFLPNLVGGPLSAISCAADRVLERITRAPFLRWASWNLVAHARPADTANA